MCVLAAHTDFIFKGKLSKAHIGVLGSYNHICQSIQVPKDLASSDWVNRLGEVDDKQYPLEPSAFLQESLPLPRQAEYYFS